MCDTVWICADAALNEEPQLRLRVLATPKPWSAVVLLEVVNPQPHPQGEVLALREHSVDAVGWGRKLFQHGHQRSRGNFGLYLPAASPCDAKPSQTPLVQHLSIAAVHWARGFEIGHFPGGSVSIIRLAATRLGQPKSPAPGLRCIARQG